MHDLGPAAKKEPASIMDLGPAREQDKALSTWFDDQERQNIDRMEANAQSITQLVIGLYGVLFVVLGLNDAPAYLKNQTVRWLGTVDIVAFMLALLCVQGVVFPFQYRANEEYNISERRQIRKRLTRRKVIFLRFALSFFLIGGCLLAATIIAILWVG